MLHTFFEFIPPLRHRFKTGTEEKDNEKVSVTNICFNGKEVAKLDGERVFIIVTWSMADYEAKQEKDDAELYLYHPKGCMDGKGEKRDVCPACGLITVHDKLFCGHRSCVNAYHRKAACGISGHLACYGEHGEADCGISGHRVCVGEHHGAVCRVSNHYVCDGKVHTAAACEVSGHLNCDGKTHTKCPCCGMLLCDAAYKAAEHTQAACGHYICADGYQVAEHEKAACGHYACQPGTHEKAGCGHYACQPGTHAKCTCGGYACIGEHAGHTNGSAGGSGEGGSGAGGSIEGRTEGNPS